MKTHLVGLVVAAVLVLATTASAQEEKLTDQSGHQFSPQQDEFARQENHEALGKRDSKNIITQSILSEFHIFTTTDDKTIKARVRAYYPDKGIVAIAKENGCTLKVDLSIFSKADQAYVREWDLIKVFFTQNCFHISVRKKKNKTGAEHMIWRMEEEIVYDIVLANRSDYDLKGLTADYCIFFEPDRPGYREQIESQSVKCGRLKIGTLAAGEKKQVDTEPVVLPKEGGFEYYEDNKGPSGKTPGIWIRIYLPLAGKRRAMRDFAMPNRIIEMRKWANRGIPHNSPLIADFLQKTRLIK